MVFDYKGDIISSLTDSWSRGQWYHIAATYDGYTQIIYIDGEYEKSAIVAGPFIVRNNNGEDVALFSNHGDIILKGSCSAGSCSYPGDDSFVIQDLLGDTIAYIDSTGDLCIEDLDCNDNDASCDSPGDGSFIVKNSTDDIISYIDGTGNLCLRGDLIENGNP